ncbi:MAG: heme-degrading domain-containing protein [Terracidiphilus sp.]|jgi:uncharacterized protein (UPF0303 family)
MNEDIDRIQLQERELHLPRLDARVAWDLGTRIKTLSDERGYSIAVDVRRFGQPLFYFAFDGTTPDSPEWIRKKSNVVARFHRSSYGFGLALALKNTTLLDRYGLPVADYAAHGGSFPFNVESAGIVGAITVTGLTQREDHELVVEALCAQLGRDYQSLTLGPE